MTVATLRGLSGGTGNGASCCSQCRDLDANRWPWKSLLSRCRSRGSARRRLGVARHSTATAETGDPLGKLWPGAQAGSFIFAFYKLLCFKLRLRAVSFL